MPSRRDQKQKRARVLIVEDEEVERAAILSCARLARCQADMAPNPGAALRRLHAADADVVILAHPTPWLRSSEQLARLQQRISLPLIVLREHGHEQEPALQQPSPAIQILPKPFIPSVLVAAIKSALRQVPRSLMELAERVELHGGLVFEPPGRRLHGNGRSATFTRQEWLLLSILIGEPNRFLGAKEIMDLGWRAGDHQADQLRIYVGRLRRKLEPLGGLRLISQQGRGYCLFTSPARDGKEPSREAALDRHR